MLNFINIALLVFPLAPLMDVSCEVIVGQNSASQNLLNQNLLMNHFYKIFKIAEKWAFVLIPKTSFLVDFFQNALISKPNKLFA